MDNTYNTALKWHNLGIATIPILASSKSPALDSWKPYMSRLPTLRELKLWFSRTEYGIGIVTGWSDLVVVDWDDAMLYSQWLASLNGGFSVVARTYRVKTRRGVHLYFKCQNVQGWKGHGVDIKAAGGYVLAPPTLHPSGHRYAAIGEMSSIQNIQAITDLIPEYRHDQTLNASTAKRLAAQPGDPFDAAMRDHESVGVSIDDIKARVQWSQIMPGLQAGRGYHKTKCPIHNEDDPSFVIYRDGHAHCFGCDFHGDIIDCWARMHNLTVGEAMAELAERFL